MSFGRPGGFSDSFKVSPPARGSFPLDHDGDCKEPMMAYLKCLKANKEDNGQCRLLSRRYLECRMDNNLMQRDDMRNLGLGDVGQDPVPQPPATIPISPKAQSQAAANSISSSSHNDPNKR